MIYLRVMYWIVQWVLWQASHDPDCPSQIVYGLSGVQEELRRDLDI